MRSEVLALIARNGPTKSFSNVSINAKERSNGDLSMAIRKLAVRILKTAWVAFAILILIATSLLRWQYTGRETEGIAMVLYYPMMLLTFPSGLLAIYVSGWIFNLVEVLGLVPSIQSKTADLMGLASTWFFASAAGYWQWFMFVPWLAKKIASGLRSWRKIGTDTAGLGSRKTHNCGNRQ